VIIDVKMLIPQEFTRSLSLTTSDNNNDKLLTPRFSAIGPEHNKKIQISIIDEGAGISPVRYCFT